MLRCHARIPKNTGRKPNVLSFSCTPPRLLYESLIEEQHNIAIHIVGLLKHLDSVYNTSMYIHTCNTKCPVITPQGPIIINPTIFNIIRWVAGSLGPKNVPSIIFFHNFLQNYLQKSFQFIVL